MVYSHQTNAGKGILRVEEELRGLFCPCFVPVNPVATACFVPAQNLLPGSEGSNVHLIYKEV